jgi:hypothetical protein
MTTMLDLFPPDRLPVDAMERALRRAVTLAPSSARPEALAVLVEYCARQGRRT